MAAKKNEAPVAEEVAEAIAADIAAAVDAPNEPVAEPLEETQPRYVSPYTVHVMPGVPSEDLTPSGHFKKGRREWHEQWNPAYPGYTGAGPYSAPDAEFPA